MVFRKIKEWDNRRERAVKGRLVFTNGRSWSRRITWLEDREACQVKIKLEDGACYSEVTTGTEDMAQTIWDRFKAGQSIDDAVSILARPVPPSLASRRADKGR